jgi:hypothetical protein
MWRLQLLGLLPTLVAAQSTAPTTEAQLAAADRAARVAALAAACDPIRMDSTWRAYPVLNADATIRLPDALGERGEILRGIWYEILPAVPRRDYALEQMDPVTTRVFLAHATSAFRCSPTHGQGPEARLSIWVLGFDDRPEEDPHEGIWNVIGILHDKQDSLWAMSRDLWGARAFVTAMRGAAFPAKQAPPR